MIRTSKDKVLYMLGQIHEACQDNDLKKGIEELGVFITRNIHDTVTKFEEDEYELILHGQNNKDVTLEDGAVLLKCSHVRRVTVCNNLIPELWDEEQAAKDGVEKLPDGEYIMIDVFKTWWDSRIVTAVDGDTMFVEIADGAECCEQIICKSFVEAISGTLKQNGLDDGDVLQVYEKYRGLTRNAAIELMIKDNDLYTIVTVKG